MSLAGLHLIAKPLDRLAAHFPRRARARAERLSEAAPDRALVLFAAAAEGGDMEAAFLVGERYLEGKGTVAHTMEAARWFHRAATRGHVRAQCRLAKLHLLGLPQVSLEARSTLFERDDAGLPDHRAALLWARPAAEAGAPDAQAMMGFILTSGPDDLRNADDAFSWYAKSAAQNYPQGRLGFVIALMLRADTEEKKRAAYLELASVGKTGIPTAHYLLGMSAERGVGTETNDVEARQHYQIAAEAGLHNAQARFGLMLLEGRGGDPDALIGESWLRRAAHGGDAEAAALLGDIYARGGTVPPNYEEAANWFRAAAELGHSTAAHALGMLHLTGAGVTQDADEAAVWFKRAAEAGDSRAQADLAELLQSGSGSALFLEPPPVHEWFERAAEEGDLVGAFNYAVCLAEGVGMPRDDERAAFWLKRAAEGVVTAQYWYGRMLAEGRGLEQNEPEAIDWFTRAAQAGLADAQVALAEMILDGRGAPRDYAAAESWFLKALPEGHVGAMFGLGELHSGGHETEADYEVAAEWFAQAAACDHPIACLMLARYAVLGLGGPQDIAAGRRWYETAVSFGVPGAADELATLNETWPVIPEAPAFDVEFYELLNEPAAASRSMQHGAS
ncbi:hypothetical protein FHS85_002525 [Rhodoligotrophos appendicifer]|uniref:tetratricopeptide repeat protein n=1 Tax=Rhodoligotrophos appendicifer TaxID=987056 RepID=UPI001184AAAC|nr:tetratricopeptide repeat protein [Rhodoligotrophos appendicifer]